jgi:tRNA(Ile)-lysidine synthase
LSDPAKSDLSGDTAAQPPAYLELLSRFHANLTDRRPLGVAVSGGSDSLGLLIGLAAVMRPEKLVALTVDHGLRAGSAEEARRVKVRCRRLGIRHETLRWQSGQPVTGLQAAARAARYGLLAEACERLGLSAMVTAHTRDDQNETLVMRQARSTSEKAPGLAGIPPATLFDGRMWVLRPLLDCHREQVRQFLREAGAADWIEDPSNQDPRFERVRVRARLADHPALRQGSDGADIAARRSRLARQAAGLIDERCHVDAAGLVRMRCEAHDPSDPAMAALEALIDWLGGAARPLDRRGKATLASFIASGAKGGEGAATNLGRVLIRRLNGHLVLRRENRDIGKLVLEPGETGIWDRRFQIRNLSRSTALKVAGGGEHGIMPCFGRDNGASQRILTAEEGVVGGYICQALAGRASRILPVYQLPVAQAVARLAGLRPFPACPWPAAMKQAVGETTKAE